MDIFLIITIIFSLIFFLFYFININLFNLLSRSVILDFKKIATENEQLVIPTRYNVNYVINNLLISDPGVLYINTNTTLLNINFAFSNYIFDINNFATIVPIVKGLKPIIG